MYNMYLVKEERKGVLEQINITGWFEMDSSLMNNIIKTGLFNALL